MTRWLILVAINIIWTKKIYNGLHVRYTSRKFAFFDDASFSLAHTFSFTHLSLLSFSPFLPFTLCSFTHAFILARTYSINLFESRYCTASLHPSALVALTLVPRYLPYLLFAAVIALSEAVLFVRPREQLTSFFFRSNKYQQRDSYTGSRTLA